MEPHCHSCHVNQLYGYKMEPTSDVQNSAFYLSITLIYNFFVNWAFYVAQGNIREEAPDIIMHKISEG